MGVAVMRDFIYNLNSYIVLQELDYYEYETRC